MEIREIAKNFETVSW